MRKLLNTGKRNLLRAVSAVVVCASIGLPAYANEFTMKIGFATMNDIQHQWGTWMKESIESGSKGRITVQLFPRNQLGTIASQIEGLQLGTVEAFTAPADFFSGVDPRFGTFSIPVYVILTWSPCLTLHVRRGPIYGTPSNFGALFLAKMTNKLKKSS